MPYRINSNCIGCGDCAMHCSSGAITRMEIAGRALSRIDPELCVSCGHCAHFCTHGAISDGVGKVVPPVPESERCVPAVDADECTGCMLCVESCPEYALSVIKITRLVSVSALTHPERCLGCGHCAKSCPVRAISMVRRRDTVFQAM